MKSKSLSHGSTELTVYRCLLIIVLANRMQLYFTFRFKIYRHFLHNDGCCFEWTIENVKWDCRRCRILFKAMSNHELNRNKHFVSSLKHDLSNIILNLINMREGCGAANYSEYINNIANQSQAHWQNWNHFSWSNTIDLLIFYRLKGKNREWIWIILFSGSNWINCL